MTKHGSKASVNADYLPSTKHYKSLLIFDMKSALLAFAVKVSHAFRVFSSAEQTKKSDSEIRYNNVG